MSDPIPTREVTPEAVYLRRRELIKHGALFVGSSALMSGGLWALTRGGAPSQGGGPATIALPVAKRGEYVVDETITPASAVTSYNNFYELGLAKSDPAENAGSLKPRPWTIAVTGAVSKPLTLDIDDVIQRFPLEERVHRMRCVEAWSMVIPWLGFPLKRLIELAQPLAAAKYVAFETLKDPEQLPGQKNNALPWPYLEGLRMDEATHPLALAVVGIYGKTLPNQNGAPIRLVVPWKYGFKGIKSIVRIHFTETQPPTTWNLAAPSEYGFYGNVNPAVDHPRWSQATERRVGELSRRPTLPFNGYAEQVASLYDGMDLTRSF